MLPASHSDSFVMEGLLPGAPALRNQSVRLVANGLHLADLPIPYGDFQLNLKLPPELHGQALRLTLTASRWLVPGRFTLRGDRRRLAYRLHALRWSEPSELSEDLAAAASAGI
jgi:hypothetical protein